MLNLLARGTPSLLQYGISALNTAPPSLRTVTLPPRCAQSTETSTRPMPRPPAVSGLVENPRTKIRSASYTRIMEEAEITGRYEVTNVIGASGTVAMQRLLNEEGADDVMMMMGLGVVGATYTFDSQARAGDATPLALMVEEQEGVLVPGDSEFETIDGLVEAWQADPGGINVGGGSAPGGPDHLFPMELAREVGVQPSKVNYISYDGGGPLTSALLGAKIDVGTSGLGEFEGQIADGELRVLAVSGRERLEGIDAPTLQESGIDLTFTNWRGFFAPPGISDEARDELIGMLVELHGTPEWEQALVDNGWTDAFATGVEFEEFLVEQNERVETTLEELGLA